MPQDELEQKLQILISNNRKIEAVKLYFEHAKCSLKEAKDYVDNFNLSNTSIQNSKSVNNSFDDQEILDLIFQRKLIQAVKVYRDKTGCDLKEAKDYIDHLSEKNPSIRKTQFQQNNNSEGVITEYKPSFLKKLIISLAILLILTIFYHYVRKG